MATNSDHYPFALVDIPAVSIVQDWQDGLNVNDSSDVKEKEQLVHKYISVDIRKRTINIMELDHERCILGSDILSAQCRRSND